MTFLKIILFYCDCGYCFFCGGWLLTEVVMNESKSTTEKGRKGHPRRHVTAVVNAALAAVACPIAR